MRLSNEEFAAEVLRRSAQKQRADRIRRRRILMTVGSAAACLVLVIGVSVRGNYTKNAARSNNADRPAAEDNIAAEQSPSYGNQTKSEGFTAGEQNKTGQSPRSATVLYMEQTAFDLAQTPQITVTLLYSGKDTVTVSAHDFVFGQAEQRYALPDDAEADSITVSPGENGKITLTPTDYIGEQRGEFTLVCIPFDAKLTLTFE